MKEGQSLANQEEWATFDTNGLSSTNEKERIGWSRGTGENSAAPPKGSSCRKIQQESAGGIESDRVRESEASDQKGQNTRLALFRNAWAEEGDRYSFSRPQTDQLMDRGSSCVEYATPDSPWTGIITFDRLILQLISSLHFEGGFS